MAVLSVSATMVAGVLSAGSMVAANAAPATDEKVISSAARLSPEVARTMEGSGTEAKQEALAAYWNSDRMKSAESATEMPSVRTAATEWTMAGAVGKPQGPADEIAPSTPEAAPVAAQPNVSLQASMPNYPVGHIAARTNGKIFFTNSDRNYVCSGAIVNTEGKSVVWTAGHCLTSGGRWHYNWTFVPNYSNGAAPYGYWYSHAMAVPLAYFNDNNDTANDVGASVMERNNGQRIADYLGSQGIAWNYPAGGNYVHAFGYPQGPPFDGCCLYTEEGDTYGGGPGHLQMGGTMTGGSSGGPWLKSFDGNLGYINGHTDIGYKAFDVLISPYYGNQVKAVYKAVRYDST